MSTALNLDDPLHRAAVNHLQMAEALAGRARKSLTLADECDGVGRDALRDTAQVLADLSKVEVDRCRALVDDIEA